MDSVFGFVWESELIVWLQDSLGRAGAAAASFLSLFGEELTLVAVLGFLYWCLDKRLGIRVGMSLLAASAWNPMLKNIVLRPRPYMADPRIRCLKAVDADADLMDVAAQGYSFPSGHSASAAATYPAAATGLKKRWILWCACGLVFLVGVSRFVLGVHYPTDVLAGWVLGILALVITGFLEKHIASRPLLYLILLLTIVPGFFYCRTNDFFSAAGMMAGLALGDLFERKFVNFENTRRPLPIVLRLAGGIALFFALNTLLKLPFSEDFLESGTGAAFAVRAVRYLIVSFGLIGLYPMAFGLLSRGRSDSEKSLKKEN